MPTTTLQANAAGTTTTVSDSVELERGILEAITVTTFENTVPVGACFARVAIQNGTNILQNTTVQLLSGYPSTGNPIAWTGRIHMQAGDRVTLYATSSVAANTRCAIRVFHED